MLYRLRSEFRLSILVLVAIASTAFALPMGFYALATGATSAALADFIIVATTVAAAAYAWRSRDARGAAWFLVAIGMVLGVFMARVPGASGKFAMFTVLLAAFLLVDRRIAAALSAVSLVAIAVEGSAFPSRREAVVFLLNGALMSTISFAFAARSDRQRRLLERLATHDALTGLHNRRALESELRIAVESHRRTGMSFALVMLDLDHFKRINDVHGHERGDRVLVALAGILAHSVRRIDRVFRFGGEEFVLILPGADGPGLRTVAAHLQDHFARELEGPEGNVTASFGAAVLRSDEDAQGWMARADAALYRAKADGRDRVVLDDDSSASGPAR